MILIRLSVLQILIKLVILKGCIHKSSDYCNEIVEKSVCNLIKNDCFCPTGSVAIREDDKLSCKTLLTNLKCRVDSECIHVQKSSCHPGAGKCTCPYNTIFVQELHACRLRMQYTKSPFCSICKKLKGDCYKYNENDKISLSYNESTSVLGCACISGRRSLTIADMNLMCSGYVVDIGEYCDEEKYFCHSNLAICSDKTSFSLQNRFCSCIPNQIAVYQLFLDYHECFDVVKYSEICKVCENVGGTCYDENKDGVPDGCICPKYLSHATSDYSLRNDDQICSVKHINVDCSNNYLSICYNPHFHPPYENLYQMLKNNRSSVGINIQRSQTNFNNQCRLVWAKNKDFCIQLSKFNQLSECLVYKLRIQNKKVMYKANLHIIFDHSSQKTNKDMQFQLSCISDDTFPLDHQRITIPYKPSLSFVKINLDIVNENGDIIKSAHHNEQIRLQASIKTIENANYQYYLRAEHCYLSNSSESFDQHQSFGEVKFITNGCPKAINGFNVHFQDIHSTKTSIVSDKFSVFQSFQPDSVQIRCIIKVCAEQASCYPVPCSEKYIQKHRESGSTLTSPWIYVERVTRLALLRNSSNKINNHVQKPYCHHLICLSINQTLLIGLILGGVIIGLLSLLVIYGSSKIQKEKTHTKQPVNTSKISVPLSSINPFCSICSSISQTRSYVTFNNVDLKASDVISCYPLVDARHHKNQSTMLNEYLSSPKMNIRPTDEIYEC